MSFIRFHSLCVLFMICINFSHQQQAPLSPCPKVFHYETDGIQWFGIIEIKSLPPGSVMKLFVKMSIAQELPTQYGGKIELLGEIGDLLNRIINGLPIRYKIHFPLLGIIPKVTNIKFNNETICTGHPARGKTVTTTTLEHVLRTDTAVDNSESQHRPNDEYEGDVSMDMPSKYYPDKDKKPSPDTYASTSKPDPEMTTLRPSNNGYSSNTALSCGISKTTNTLIISGKSTKAGEWPWLAAMYKKEIAGLKFICAGTLISNRHVVTASHCVHEKGNPRTKNEELLIKVGAHDLQQWVDVNSKAVNVLDIQFHPTFEGGLVLKADIAILVIDVVTFSDYIIPICLWNEDGDLSLVVGLNATVVGWGRDENGLVATPEPRKAIVPIVSTKTCRSTRVEFSYHTSNTTFCAGSRIGIGPCNGDSGGGLYMWRNSNWALRGIISNSLEDHNSFNKCNLFEFVIFTDVAKYLPWIKSVIQ